MKSSTYYLHVKTKIVDFQICISVSLKMNDLKIQWFTSVIKKDLTS